MNQKEGFNYLDKSLKDFSQFEEKDLLNEFQSSEQGLSSFEALKRLKKIGPNTFEDKKKYSVLLQFLKYFKSPLIIILIIAAVVSLFLGEEISSIIIIVMVFLSLFLDFYQEYHANKSAEKLKNTIKTKVNVVRDGREQEIKIDDLVPGDIIILSAGKIVPADVRILSAKDFFVNQSALTGESFPCAKLSKIPKAKKTPINEFENLAFMGTSVISGYATALVLKTGKKSEFGQISENLISEPPPTEFKKGVTKFSYLIMKITLFLVLFIFLFSALIRKDFINSFLFAIAVAVGLTPELLPVIMSVNLARGSIKMAKKGVIVKELSSISNLGGMDVLCVDKTGTITENKIKLIKHVDLNGKNSEEVLLHSYINSYYQTGVENPLTQAILDFKHLNISGYGKIDEIPFDFLRKRSSIIVKEHKNSQKSLLISKGAPEDIFKICSSYSDGKKSGLFDSSAKKQAIKTYENLSSQGFRVLAVAVKKINSKKSNYGYEDEFNLKLLGFVAFLDPPKIGVKKVLQEINSAGIEVKIITGDNDLVTKKICNEISLNIKGIILGSDISSLNDDALKIAVEKNTIFARISPEQKNRIIFALKSNNHVVGYLGDGINDAISLKNADVGISVNSAVDIAKESASIVLTHKSLEILKEGILDGRRTFGNTMKYMMMGLSSNFGNMFSVTIAILFLPFLPMLPVQILLNNFIYDFSQITLPSDNVDKEFIKKPKKWNMKFLKKFMILFGLISSVFDLLAFFFLFVILKVSSPVFQTAWFIESLATQILVIHVIRTKHSPFFKSKASKYLLMSTFGCVILGWLIPYLFIGKFFYFEKLSFLILILMGLLVIIYLFLVELIKRRFYKKNEF